MAPAADEVGLTCSHASPEALPSLDASSIVVAALDHRLVTESRSLAEWKAAIAAAHGAEHAALLLITDGSVADLPLDVLEVCDDVASIAGTLDLERALKRALKLARERFERRAEEPDSRLRLREIVAEGLSDVIVQLNSDLRITYVNPAWETQLGRGDRAPIDRYFLDYVVPEQREKLRAELERLILSDQTRLTTEIAFLSPGGQPIWMDLRALFDPHSSSGGVITGLLVDISSRQESDAELRASHEHYRQLALRDPLTGLSNRIVFTDRLQNALDVGVRRGSGLALLFIDLDNFKAVNDSHGHSIGDRVLTAVANRMSEQIRAGDMLARYGGDEFAVILEDLSDPTQALQIADRLIEASREPLLIGVEAFDIGLSIGINLLSGRSVTFAEAIAEADAALIQAKRNGRRQYRLFEPGHQPGKEADYRFDLRRGIKSQELTILYLPIFDLATREVTSLEARIRWDHPEWGRLSPGQFLRRADANELMGDLAKEALFLMARDIKYLMSQGLEVPQVRIALAVWQAINSDLVGLFSVTLAEMGLEGKQFAIELLDISNPVERDAVRPVIAGLRELGLGIGFDNFMTGVTPLGGVVDLDPVYVNLYAQGHALADKGYNTREIAEAARLLSDKFGWELIAKDLDTPEMLAAIEDLPIQYGQGDAIAPGMGVADLITFLRNR